MKNFLNAVLETRTIKDSFVTSLGTAINGLLGLFFYAVLGRFLGPLSYGIFSVSVDSMTLLKDIGTTGIDTGIVRFVGKYAPLDRQKALKFLKLSLELKIGIWILIFILGWLSMPFIALTILGKPELLFPLRLSLFGVGTGLLFSLSTYAVQSFQKFWVWSGLNILSNLGRLITIFVLVALGMLTVNSSLLNYMIWPLIGFFISLLFLPNFFKVKNEFEVGREFLNYNKWIALFTLIAAVSSRLDIYISATLLPLYQVGIYAAATQLASIVPQVVFAFGAVVAPKLASFDSDTKAFIYLKKLQALVIIIASVGIIIGIPLAKYFVLPFFYGKEYLGAIIPFSILLVTQAIFLISIPVHTAVIYYFAYPKLFVYISLGHLLIMIVGGYYLISSFGIVGAAVTALIGNIFNFAVPFIWTLRKFRNLRK